MQLTWKTFRSLDEAAQGRLRGATRASLQFATQQLFVGEVTEWVATASINQAISWDDGVVLLTDQRLMVSSCDEYGNVSMQSTARATAELTELAGPGYGVVFLVRDLLGTQIQLQKEGADWLRAALQHPRADVLVPETKAPDASSMRDQLLKELRNLHQHGVLSDAEFAQKMSEVIDQF
jgi:hypothetical protein